jgi:hypothetical protein
MHSDLDTRPPPASARTKPAGPANRNEAILDRLVAFGTSPTPIEILLASLVLAVFGAVIFASHILHGALYFDDFAIGANSLYPPGGRGLLHAISAGWAAGLYRPVLVVYAPLTFYLTGTHASLQIALAILLAVTVAVCAFGVLRSLGLPTVHAGVVAGLTLAYPWYDALRMWSTASEASLAITFALGGLWVALVGIRRGSSRWHVAAALLYLTSILTYEVTIPAILGAGLVYGARSGWRSTRRLWLMDIVAAAIGTAWVFGHEVHQSYGIAADITHAREIASAGVTMTGRSVIAPGLESHTAIAIAGLLVALAIGIAMIVFRASWAGDGIAARRWLWMMAGGLGLAILGWAIFIPADPYYTPTIWGVTNRVNAVAGLGCVVLVYGALGIIGDAVRGATRNPPVVASMITVGLAVFLGATYVRVLERHERVWNAAGRLETKGINVIKSDIPRLAQGSTLFVGGWPAYYTLGVPVYSTDWDLNGLTQLTYHTHHVNAYPLLAGWKLTCGPSGVFLSGLGAPPTVAPYGHAWLIDLATNQRDRPVSRAACARETPHYAPGPLYLTTTY